MIKSQDHDDDPGKWECGVIVWYNVSFISFAVLCVIHSIVGHISFKRGVQQAGVIEYS